jgi:multidrug efflux system membrane fusion protein
VTGLRQVDIGNLVLANSTQPLVMVTQIQPIYVVFALPEVDIQRVRTAMALSPLQTLAFDPKDQTEISQGTLDLVDNNVDQTTGTVRLKSEFPNKDTALWPGQFVNAHLVLEVVHDGITIPAAAVQTGPNGPFVYVVSPQSTAEMRPLEILRTENDISLVGSGLKLGELVVTVGQSRLSPGMKLRVSNEVALNQ